MNEVRQACDNLGGVNATARKMKVKPPSVSEWIKKGIVPPKRVKKLSVLSGVPEERLNPDDFDVEETKKSA